MNDNKNYSNEEKLKYYEEKFVFHQQKIGELRYLLNKQISLSVKAQKRIVELREEIKQKPGF